MRSEVAVLHAGLGSEATGLHAGVDVLYDPAHDLAHLGVLLGDVDAV